ncbi:hypothetical protein N9H82_03570 [Flavobacteriaceae bacterium]|nr:hypothetical protein [Flavobacteriaceae bacterium]
MAIQPQNNGLITENNEQYYAGSQGFRGDAGNTENQLLPTDFNTDLILGSATSWNPNDVDYALNNFKVYTSTSGISGSWSEWITALEVINNGRTIKLAASPGANAFIVVQLTILTGGKYGNTEAEKAYGQAVEDNYGSYQYIKLNDVINNFAVGYVGQDKLLPNVKRSDIIFFAKRAMQEFSYDTLKSIKSAELTIPPSLTLVIPQDYVNYVRCSWIDSLGVKHIIYPTNNLTISPYYTQVQDSTGIPTQDNFGNDVEGTPITQERWHSNSSSLSTELNGNLIPDAANAAEYGYGWEGLFGFGFGQLYGLDPQTAQGNGWFNINERENKLSFSSNLVGRLIVFEYISDGLAYDLDSRIPKMAEDAMYASILYSLMSNRINQPEYVVQRLKKDRSAKLRNAKIRLSNIKLDEICQVMRGKSKWIKH